MARKTVAKTAQVKAAPVTQFAALFGALAWGFVESAAANASRSADAVRIIGELYASIKGDAYAAEVARLFGNGEKGKTHEPGVVKTELEARAKAEGKDVPPTARDFLSKCRTVALAYGKPEVRKAAEESGIRAGYDAAKPKAASESSGKDAPKATPVSFAEIVMAEIARVGLASVLGVVESALVASKDPIRAAVVHDARVKVAA